MDKTKPIRNHKAPLRSVVFIMIIAVVVVLGIECYREWKNYERTADYESARYVIQVFQLTYLFADLGESPIDLQAMVDDLGLIPPPNPYRRDHKTIISTIDKRIPGAIWYIPGPLEAPYVSASGLFLHDQSNGTDLITEGDDPWLIGWRLSKPDGIPDGMVLGLSYIQDADRYLVPLKNTSWLWKWRWKDGFGWKSSDGSVASFDQLLSKFKDYRRRHPENFAAEKRPMMPKGFTITKEDAKRAFMDEAIWSFYKKLYGYDPVVGDEKAKN